MTNVNIFALAPQAGGAAAAPEAFVEPVPEAKPDESLVSTQWLEKRSRRLDSLEQDLRERALDLERREAELEEREARSEADLYLREDALEERERTLHELEQRLGRRESELGTYVARLQGGLLRADAF